MNAHGLRPKSWAISMPLSLPERGAGARGARSQSGHFDAIFVWFMTRRALLIVTVWLAATGAHAEPQAEDAVLDPWARVSASPVAATWSPPTVALIVNPWDDQVRSREALRTPRRGDRGQAELTLAEIVDPWAGRPTVPTAAFPAEGVVDPWQSRAVRTPGRPYR